MSNNKTQKKYEYTINKKTIILGGIVKHSDGLGFKITFQDRETANHWKDAIRWMMIQDKHPLIYKIGYYDNYNEEGMSKC